MESQKISAKANTQITYRDLKIGVGYIGVDPEFLEAEGSKVQSAQLWPFLKYEEKGRHYIMVHEGEIITIDKYQLEIVNITKRSVTIEFSELARE